MIFLALYVVVAVAFVLVQERLGAPACWWVLAVQIVVQVAMVVGWARASRIR